MTTLQTLISNQPNSGDLTALSANDKFRTAVDAEMVVLETAAEKAQVLASKTADLQGVVSMFSVACQQLRAIAKRFPETTKYVDEAIKQTQLAMSVVEDNPPKPVPAPAAAAAKPPVPAAAPVPAIPVVTSATVANVKMGTALSYRITATGAPTSFGASGLPAGLKVDTASGLISGTPTGPGTSHVSLSATNAHGTGSSSLTLVVA